MGKGSDSRTFSDNIFGTMQDRPSPVASGSTVVDVNGGECKVGDVILSVPPGAVWLPTTISADVYVDNSVTPTLDEKQKLALSSVVRLSPSGLRFNVPVWLSFPPNVPLNSSRRETGCQLELKMTDTSIHDASRKWYTALDIDTVTGVVKQPLQDVEFDSEKRRVSLRKLRTCGWIGKLVQRDVETVRRVLYAVFGKVLESRKWMILLDVINCETSKYGEIVDDMKKSGFIALSPPTSATIYRHGEVTVKVDSIGKWKSYFGEWKIKAETIVDHCYHTVIVEDLSGSSESLSIAVKASCTLKGELRDTLTPSTLIIAYPLGELSQRSYLLPRDRFHALVVCAQESELQAAQHVFEKETKDKFVRAHHDLPCNLRLCREWMSSPSTSVALVAQPIPGGTECMKLLSQLAKYFSADLIAMTGICAGEENKYGRIEYGSVVVAQRTTTARDGKVTTHARYHTQARYEDVDRRLAPSLRQLAAEGVKDWIKCIPDIARGPSARCVRELILHEMKKCGPTGIAKLQLLDRLKELHLPDMSRMAFDEILYQLMKQTDPWLQAKIRYGDTLILTENGEKYVSTQVDFPRKDMLSVAFDSMGAIDYESDILETGMLSLMRNKRNGKSFKLIDKNCFTYTYTFVCVFLSLERTRLCTSNCVCVCTHVSCYVVFMYAFVYACTQLWL